MYSCIFDVGYVQGFQDGEDEKQKKVDKKIQEFQQNLRTLANNYDNGTRTIVHLVLSLFNSVFNEQGVVDDKTDETS